MYKCNSKQGTKKTVTISLKHLIYLEKIEEYLQNFHQKYNLMITFILLNIHDMKRRWKYFQG